MFQTAEFYVYDKQTFIDHVPGYQMAGPSEGGGDHWGRSTPPLFLAPAPLFQCFVESKTPLNGSAVRALTN